MNDEEKQYRAERLDLFAAMAMQGDWAAQDEVANGCITTDTAIGPLMHRARLYYRMAEAMESVRGEFVK